MSHSIRKLSRVLLLSCACVVSASTARAQTTAPSASSTTAPAPTVAIRDEVETHAGVVVRGTIVERVPEDYVVIQSASGQLHRFVWADVEYAGPIDRPATPTSTDAPAT